MILFVTASLTTQNLLTDRMKYGVVSYSNSINMGDEVQSVAARRLLPSVDYYIDRDTINKQVSAEKIKLICSGWFTEKPHSWPPAENIIPLIISFHVTRSNRSHKLLLKKELLDYYKQFEPVGCRDLGTLRLFEENGIDAWYSGDLTLTLENKFSERNDDILLVDPLRHNYTKKYRDHIISQIVPAKYYDNVRIINQRRTQIDISTEERFRDAENLIELYSKAKIVITSRIHCALPCLALGTPVYFINAGYHSTYFNLNDRFDGIIDMFRIIDENMFPFSSSSLKDIGIRGFNLFRGTRIKPLPIDWQNPEPNNFDFSTIKEALIQKVNKFIQ